MHSTRSIISLSQLILFALAGVIVIGCNQSPKSLAQKQKVLLAKKADLRKLSEEISTLEADIARLDPSIGDRVRIAAVSIEEVKPSVFQHFIDVQGAIEAKDNVLVSPQSAGRVTAIYVKEGQTVNAGQRLAQIDDAVMVASMAEIETQLTLAEDLRDRQQRLWDQGIGTEVQLIEAKNRVESLERRLATQKEQISLSSITSPIAGTVEQVLPKVGEVVSPGMPAFRIVNNRDLSLNAKLSEVHIPRIRKGDLVEIEFPALNQSFQGKVAVVGQSIDASDRTFHVEVSLPRHENLKPNMFGTLRINDETVKDAVVLPLALIQRSEVGPFVFVAQQEGETWTAERRNLTTGLSYDGKTTVLKGLSHGDRLITAGYKDLSDGQAIEFTDSLAGN